jgi:hypothetical protein
VMINVIVGLILTMGRRQRKAQMIVVHRELESYSNP